MDNVQIKKLYDEAAQTLEQAKAISKEFFGKEMPKEKETELNALLDAVEAKTEQAKALERQAANEKRMADADKFLNEPANRKDIFTQVETQGGEVTWNGRKLTAEEVAELKGMVQFKHFINADNPEYGAAMRAYMRKGLNGLTTDQIKALSVGDPGAGGYLVQDTFLATLIAKQREISAMRRIGNVLPPVPSGSAIAPAEESFLSDAAWTTEVATGAADTVKPFGQRRLTPHPLAKRILVSNTLLRNPLFDVEGYVRDRMAYKHAVPEENAFIQGDGAQKPLGLLNTVGLPTFTTATSLALHGDDIINWIYSLPEAYARRPNNRILCARTFVRKVRALATKNASVTFTNYIWQPGLAAGAPSMILDTPYEISDQFPTGLDGSDAWTANSIPAVVGDFSYYWIVDALQMSIQRLVELYAEANQVGFIGRKEADGMAVLADAFYALKIKA